MLSMSGKMMTIHVDNSKFYISPKTLAENKETVLYQAILGNNSNPRVCVSRKGDVLGPANLPDVYIDADEESFKYIVSYLRGYQDDRIFNAGILKGKVYCDAKYFNIKGLVNILDQYDSKFGDSSKMYSDTFDDLKMTGGNIKDDLDYASQPLLESLGSIEDLESIGDLGSISDEINETINVNVEDLQDTPTCLSDNNMNLENILNINSEEKAEFDEDVILQANISSLLNLKRDDLEEQYGGDNINTSALFSNDKADIIELVNTIQSRLKSPEAFNVMNMISTDHNITNLLRSYNARTQASTNTESSFSSRNWQTEGLENSNADELSDSGSDLSDIEPLTITDTNLKTDIELSVHHNTLPVSEST